MLAAIVRAGYDSRDSPPPLVNLGGVLPAAAFSELFDDIVDVLQNLRRDIANTQVPSRHAALHEAQGTVALFQENQEQAVGSFRQAVEIWQTVERPYDQARALKNLGQALALTGKQTESGDAFTKGFAIITELAAQLDDAEMKKAFLQSPLAQAIQYALPTSGATR